MRSSARQTLVALCLVAALTGVAVAAETLIAAGDSLTAGVGDPEGKGYPRRLEVRLRKALEDDEIEVINEGRLSDTSLSLLARFDSVLAHDARAVILMIGTNDVSLMADGELAPEATAFNIEAMARQAERAGFEVVQATIVPRPRFAFRDSRNFLTRRVVWDVREAATSKKRKLADPYQALDPAQMPQAAAYYAPQFDPETGDRDFVGHLNPDGYDVLAEAISNVLLGIDSTPPVIGSFLPGLVGAVEGRVPEDQLFSVPLYEPEDAAGFDVDNTFLTINGFRVGAIVGKPKKGRAVVEHRGLEGLGCLADLAVTAQDKAEPPNVLVLPLGLYEIEGRTINAGDVDYNCLIDDADITRFAASFGSEKGQPGFSDLIDFVNDDRIDGLDFAVLARNFGKSSL